MKLVSGIQSSKLLDLGVTEPGFTTNILPLAASLSSGVVYLDSSNSLFLAVDSVFVCNQDACQIPLLLKSIVILASTNLYVSKIINYCK